MTTSTESARRHPVTTIHDGFEVLDACHQDTVRMLKTLEDLVESLDNGTPDAAARAKAAEVASFFAGPSRLHHEDEERHVFPKLAASTDPDIVQAVARLRQDHGWLQQDWLELAPQLEAIASGQNWYDLATLREGVAIFTQLSHEHVELEESFIYPEARARARPADRQEMGREMTRRRREQHAAALRHRE